MNPLTKAQARMGLIPIFYQKFWDVLGDHVTSSCTQWLNFGEFPHDINDTHRF